MLIYGIIGDFLPSLLDFVETQVTMVYGDVECDDDGDDEDDEDDDDGV